MATAWFDSEGRIICISGGVGMAAPEGAGVWSVVADDTDPNSIWFDGSAVQLKAEMALSVERNRLSGIPAGAIVNFGEHVITVDDGVIEFEADTEKLLRVIVEHPAYLATTADIPTGPEVSA